MIRFLFLSVLILATTHNYGQQQGPPVFASSPALNITGELRDYKNPVFIFDMPGRIQVFVNEGINLLKEESYFQAINNLDSAIILDPTLWIAHYYRGITKSFIGQLDAAEKDFTNVVEINPNAVEGYLELGKLYATRHSAREAIKAFQRAASIRPNIPEPYFYMGLMELRAGRSGNANNLFSKCLKMDPNFAPAYVVLAVLLKGKTSESITLLSRAIKAQPTYVSAYFYRGFLLAASQRYTESLADFNTAIRLKPRDMFYMYCRILLNATQNNYNDILSDIRKITAIRQNRYGPDVAVDDPYFAGTGILDTYIGIETCAEYLAQKGYGMATPAFELLKRSLCKIIFNLNEEAVKDATEANKLEPSAAGFYLKAVAFDDSKLYDSAANNYHSALRLDNDIFDAHKKRGFYRAAGKDWKGAYQDLNEMKRLRPNSNPVYRLSGEIKQSLNDNYGAILDFTKYLKKDSSNSDVRTSRAACRAAVGDFAGANTDLFYIEKNDSSIDVYRDVVRNHEAMKDTAGAHTAFRRGEAYEKWVVKDQADFATIFFEFNDWAGVRMACASARLAHAQFLKSRRPVLSRYQLVLDLITYYEIRLDFLDANYSGCIVKASEIIPYAQSRKLELLYYRGAAYLELGQKRKAKTDLEGPAKAGFADAKEKYESIKSW